jgi:hypothetical protein
VNAFDDYTTPNGSRVHHSNNGQRHTITPNGITSAPDPYHSPADAAALECGEIDVVEYRRRYLERYRAA